MQYEIILNSRTYSLDYRWIARPAYISEALCDRVRDLMYLLERAGNLTDEDYLRNIFFFADESGGVLVRGGYSRVTDKFGRQIYSVEGIACPAAQLRRFWYALPVLIAWMTQCPLFRDTWVYGMAEETDLSGLKVDIAELGEDGGDRLLAESGFFSACPAYVQECLWFLQEDVQAAEQVFPFAFIPGDSRIYLESLSGSLEAEAAERIYTSRTIRQMQQLTAAHAAPFTKAEITDDSYQIEVQIRQDKENFYARLTALDHEGREIAFMDRELVFNSVGLELSRLESAAQQLRSEIRIYGYRREE